MPQSLSFELGWSPTPLMKTTAGSFSPFFAPGGYGY